MAIRRGFFSALALLAMLVELAVAVDHAVGGTGGWSVATDLKTWASSQTFQIGDNLVFQYSPTLHDMVEVPKADFDACQARNPIGIYTNGNTTVPLTTPGKRYFICAMPGHCSRGMKLEVNTMPPDSSTAVSPPEASPPSILPPAAGRLPGLPSPLLTPASSPVSQDSPALIPASSPVSDDSSSLSPAESPLLPGQVTSVSPIPEVSPLIPAESPVSGPGSTIAAGPLTGPGKSVTTLPSATTAADIASAGKIGIGKSLVLGFSMVFVMFYGV